MTLRLAGRADTLTIDVTLAESAEGTSMVRLATRGGCRAGFDTAHAVLHDVARALDTQCQAVRPSAAATKMGPWNSMSVTARC